MPQTKFLNFPTIVQQTRSVLGYFELLIFFQIRKMFYQPIVYASIGWKLKTFVNIFPLKHCQWPMATLNSEINWKSM